MAVTKKQLTMNAGEDVDRREPLCIAGVNADQSSYYWSQYRGSSENKINLLCDLIMPLLGIYPQDSSYIYHRDTCTSVIYTCVKCHLTQHMYSEFMLWKTKKLCEPMNDGDTRDGETPDSILNTILKFRNLFSISILLTKWRPIGSHVWTLDVFKQLVPEYWWCCVGRS